MQRLTFFSALIFSAACLFAADFYVNPEDGGTFTEEDGRLFATVEAAVAAAGDFRFRGTIARGLGYLNCLELTDFDLTIPFGQTDLNGARRIVRGKIDMGCYEYQHSFATFISAK